MPFEVYSQCTVLKQERFQLSLDVYNFDTHDVKAMGQYLAGLLGSLLVFDLGISLMTPIFH